ncbi:MAG: orotidine-5'-phosphate decarboxylase, partial [Firmicutes bacterium]|nr:orotidine-5'-phosphate decarboxylase [Bacillota bacterium]
MITDILLDEVKRKSCVCLGLDTRPAYLPSFIAEKDQSTGEEIFEFNKRIVDATCDLVGCYKVQVACYEALGMDGMMAYSRTLKYIRSKGSIVIADVKRGDISSTAEQYALGHFSGDFEADFITVNAYMGEDAVSPYYPFLEKDKGLFVLVKTSNKSGVDF